MKFGRLLVTAAVAASLMAPAAAAVRPSVKPIDLSVQQAVTPAVHRAGRAGAELKNANEFIPFLGAGLFGFAASTAASLTVMAAVNRFVVRLPLLDKVFENVGVGRDDAPSSPGS